MSRGQIYISGTSYVVIDSRYDTVVIRTTEKRIALYWQSRVNDCEHDFPYDILRHDYKAESADSSYTVEQS